MLSKGRRITRHQFPTDLRQGAVVHSPHLSLRITPLGVKLPAAGSLTPKKKIVRISVVVSKKVAAKATDRHRVKRRVYDGVARAEKRMKLPAGLYVFFAKKDAHMIPFAQLADEIITLCTDASAIVKQSWLV